MTLTQSRIPIVFAIMFLGYVLKGARISDNYVDEEARQTSGHVGHHGIYIQYSGVDYLLVYWMIRCHGLVC